MSSQHMSSNTQHDLLTVLKGINIECALNSINVFCSSVITNSRDECNSHLGVNVNPISGSFQNISATQAVCTLRLLCIVVASFSGDAISKGKRTPKSVKRRSSRVDFRLRNPSSPDVVLVIKALFSIFDPHNRVETNMYFVFAYDFV